MNTCDHCDALKSADPSTYAVWPGSRWHSYGGKASFAGPVRTVRCLDDNSRVKEAVEGPGEGCVLVVDGGESLRRALLGGNLAAAAARNGWAGLLIHGAVRDRAELRAQPIGIWALGHVPMPTDRAGQGLSGVPVQIDGQVVHPGAWLMADDDGLLVLPARP